MANHTPQQYHNVQEEQKGANMKETIVEIIAKALPDIISVAMLFVLTFIVKKTKTIVNTDVKKSVVADTVKYVEQIYKDIHGDEKVEKCKDKVIELLAEQGIKISDSELSVLIESAVQEMNKKPVLDFVEALKNKQTDSFDVGEYKFEGDYVTAELDRNGDL